MEISPMRTGFSRPSLRKFYVCTAIALIGLAPRTDAANNFYWVGDNVTNPTSWAQTTGLGGSNWSFSPNFNLSTGTTLPGAADSVFFYFPGANVANLNTVLGQDFSIASLDFMSSATTSVTIGGANKLTLGTGGLIVEQLSGSHTISSLVGLGGVQTWANNSTNALTVSGVISGAAANNLTIGGLSGNGGFTLTAANTYTGTTTLSTNGATLTLSGANGSLATTAITMLGGSVLNLDNTVTNNSSRVGSTVPIGSAGGTINLKGASGTQTLGQITLNSGTTRINVDPGSTLTLGTAAVAGVARTTGGAVNYSPNGSIIIPNQTITNGIIGGYATIGNIGTVQQDANGNANVLDFAALDGTNKVVAYSGYVNNNTTADFTATNNVKVSNLVALPAAAVSNANSLYVTGTARVQIGTDNTTTSTLVIGSGGIISNGATQTLGGAGPQIDMINSATIGNSTISANGAAGGNITGILTAGTSPSLVNDLVVTTASNLRISALIADNGTTKINLVKNGSGTLDLSDGNGTTATSTYTGKTIVNGGLLVIRNDRNLGAVPAAQTPDAITLNGGEYRMTATITVAANRGTTVGPQGGTISYNGGNTTHLTGYLVTGPGSIQYSCIPGFGNVSANQCAMDIGFGTTNYAGSTTFFTQGSTAAGPISSVIYFSGSNKVPDGSAVTVTTAAGSGGGTGILNMFGNSDTWGSLAGNGPILNGSSTLSALTVGGNNLSTTYSGSLGTVGATWSVGAANNNGADRLNAANPGPGGNTGSTGAISLTKVGTGTMTMTGVNGYTGATNVNGGKLLVAAPGSLATTTVTVAGGALGGNGTIGGPVSITGTGILAPAVPNGSNVLTPATLTINNTLSFGNGATFNYLFGASGSPGISDTVNVTGAVTFTAGTDILNINALSGFGVGTYNLITGAAPISTSGVTFAVNGNPAFLYAIAPNGNNLVLTVSPGNPVLQWTGAGNAWQNGGPVNWFNGSSTTAFANGNNAVFDDNGLANPVVQVAAAGVTASSMNFAQSAGSYTFNGGAITVNTATGGTGTITIQSGDVIFNNSVSALGTTIQNGSLTVNGSLTSSILSISSGTTLAGTGTITGNATLAGTGIINLSGAGNITGSLTTTDGNWNGSGSVGSVVVTGGNFSIASGVSLTTTTAAGLAVNNAATIVAGSTGTTLAGSLTYSSSANSTFQGSITGASSVVTLNGPGTLILSGTNTYGGGTTVNGGILQFNSLASTGNGGTILIAAAGAIATGFPLDQTFVNRISPASAGAIALGADSSTPLNFSAAGTVRLGATTAVNYSGALTPNGTTYRFGGGGGTLTVSSQLTGANSVDIASPAPVGGTVIFSGPNTYSGGTTLNSGGLGINNASALGTGSLTINGGSIDNTSAGAITLASNSPVNVNGSFGYGGTKSLNLGTGAVTQAADATLTIGGTGTLSMGGVSGGKSLNVVGTGTGGIALNGASTFNNLYYSGPGTMSLGGNTTISGGLSVFGGAVTQPSLVTYQFSVTGGTLQVAPNATVTAAGLVMGGVDATNANTSSSAQITLGSGASLNVDTTTAATPPNIVIGSNSGSGSIAVGTALIGQGTASVNLKAPAIVIGSGGGATQQSANTLVALGTGSNSLVATTAAGITIGTTSNGGEDGDFTRNNQLGLAMIVLGTGNNTIQTPALFVAGSKSPGSVFLGNGPIAMTSNGDPVTPPTTPVTSTTYAPPVPLLKPDHTGYAQVTVSDAGGAKTAMTVGYQPGGASGTNSIGVFDTTGGILNGTFGTVTLGSNGTAPSSTHGGAVGSWVMGVANNNVTVDSVQMTNTPTVSQGITGAIFSLNGGTVTFAASGTGFSFGNAASAGPVTAAINLNGGTLNMNGSPLVDPNTSTSLLSSVAINGGTLKNATGIFVTGGLVQNGGVILRDQAGTTLIGNGGVFPGSDAYTITGGAVVQLNAGASNTVALSAGSLVQTTAGTLDIVPVTGNLDGAAAPREQLLLASPPTATNGILPTYIVARADGTANASADFTTYDPSTSIGRFTAYSTGNLNTAGVNDVINVSSATTLTASPTVFAMKLSSTISGAGSLTIGQAGTPAGLIMDGGTMSANTLTFASDAQVFSTGKNGTITSKMTVNGDLTTFGPGQLTLNNTTANSMIGINVNGGTLRVSATQNASGAVSVRNGATLAGTGAVIMTGGGGLALGPGATFSPGFASGSNQGNNYGVFTMSTTTGSFTTTSPTTNPSSLTSANLTFGLGISPTNVVGSNFVLSLGVPSATGAVNSGLSNANALGNLASGFMMSTSGGGLFTLDPITTLVINANPANYTIGSPYSYLIGSVPSGSNGGVTNLGNFTFINGANPFTSQVGSASFMVNNGGVYLNFTVQPVPEPSSVCLTAAAVFGIGRWVRRRRQRRTAESS
jgi:autotransporter-associated beta strand protein